MFKRTLNRKQYEEVRGIGVPAEAREPEVTLKFVVDASSRGMIGDTFACIVTRLLYGTRARHVQGQVRGAQGGQQLGLL